VFVHPERELADVVDLMLEREIGAVPVVEPVLLPPVDGLCTVMGRRDGSLRIFSWPSGSGLAEGAEASWWRQTPIGLDVMGKLLFVGVSNDTTARALALGMQHAGASSVAQLDVNWSYPKILVFPRAASGRRIAQSVFKGFVFRPEDYVARPAPRDFFYVIRRVDRAH
jgi:hypothetical protein